MNLEDINSIGVNVWLTRIKKSSYILLILSLIINIVINMKGSSPYLPVHMPEQNPNITPLSIRPERVPALSRAAYDIGKIAVRIYDPSDPPQRQHYADMLNKESNKTLDAEVIIKYAESVGLALVSIEHHQQGLDALWDRAEEINAAQTGGAG